MSLVGKSIGNYQIRAKLGEGGMGTVYLGEHPLIGKRVAVKVLLEELAANETVVSRFFNEAKAVNDIGHQNIVDIVDFGKMKNDYGSDVVYFIMEFLDGESLAVRLKRGGLTNVELLHMMTQCCSALSASHQKGIVHRDLKPDNIYLCTRGGDRNFIKILDFGIAKLTGDGGLSSHKTRTGLVIGTPSYMSPEQCEGKGLIDHRSDIYSLGVVMYELATGRVPFPGEGFGEILVAHLTKTPERPCALNPDLAPEIEAIILHAIEKDKNRRFQTMAEFEAAVRDPVVHTGSYKQLPGFAGAAMYGSDQATIVAGKAMGPLNQQTVMRGPVTAAVQRITTLSGASGEVTQMGRRSRASLWLGATVLLAAGAVGGGYLLLRGRRAPTTSVVAASQVVAAPQLIVTPVEEVVVTVASEPSGARVLRADQEGREVGRTPYDFHLKKGEPSFDVQVTLAGFAPQVRTVSTGMSKELLVELVSNTAPEQPAVQPVVRVAPTPKKRVRPHKDPDAPSDTDPLLMVPRFK